MRGMSADERQKFVDGKAQQRTQIQKQINELNAKREAFIAAERTKSAKAGKKGPKGFDDAFNGAVQKEAESQGFQFAH
jgi:hypothetical protein